MHVRVVLVLKFTDVTVRPIWTRSRPYRREIFKRHSPDGSNVNTDMMMVSLDKARFHYRTISSQTTGTLPRAMRAPWVLCVKVARASTRVVFGGVELLLAEGVVDVAVGVELVAAGAKVGRREGGGDAVPEGGGEIDDLCIGVGEPGASIETGDVVCVCLANDGGVACGVDFLRIIK